MQGAKQTVGQRVPGAEPQHSFPLPRPRPEQPWPRPSAPRSEPISGCQTAEDLQVALAALADRPHSAVGLAVGLTMATRASSEIDRIALFKCTSSENFTSPIDRRADYYRQRAREDVDADQADALTGKLPPAQPLLTIPNSLTIFRIALVPFLVVAYLHSSPSAPLLAAATFCLAAITDWADGYLARRLRIASAFGAFLDPVADKIMVATAMVLLAVRPPPGLSQEQVLMPVLISIMREIAMSSLREWAAKSSSQASKRIAVNALGKWKTALQMVGICSMYVWRDQDHLFGPKMGGTAATFLQYGPGVSLAMLWLASFFSVWSLSCYMQSIWLFFKYPDGIRPLKGT